MAKPSSEFDFEDVRNWRDPKKRNYDILAALLVVLPALAIVVWLLETPSGRGSLVGRWATSLPTWGKWTVGVVVAGLVYGALDRALTPILRRLAMTGLREKR